MNEKNLLELLRKFKAEQEIFLQLKNLSLNAVENLGFASIDHARELRQGFPEVIFAAGKTKEQVREIFKSLYEKSTGNLMATRADFEKYKFLAEEIPEAKFDEVSKMIYLDRDKNIFRDERKKILI